MNNVFIYILCTYSILLYDGIDSYTSDANAGRQAKIRRKRRPPSQDPMPTSAGLPATFGYINCKHDGHYRHKNESDTLSSIELQRFFRSRDEQRPRSETSDCECERSNAHIASCIIDNHSATRSRQLVSDLHVHLAKCSRRKRHGIGVSGVIGRRDFRWRHSLQLGGTRR